MSLQSEFANSIRCYSDSVTVYELGQFASDEVDHVPCLFDGRDPAASYLCEIGSYNTRLSARIKTKETTDARAVTRVSALSAP